MPNKNVLTLLILTIVLTGCAIIPSSEAPVQELVLATTTSTADSGLLDAILPAFEEANRIKVNVVAVGTGQAIAMGERGDADVILVHARAREDEFIADGHGIARYDVMYNDFVIVGPASDPAGVSEVVDAEGNFSATEAFKRVAHAGDEGEAFFASRGDDSGTHTKEKVIWEAAGLEPNPDDAWFLSLGQGMGATLTTANEKQAYTLSDRGTFLARQGNLDLLVLGEGDPILFNPYGVVAVNPETHPGVKVDLAQKFIEYLTSYETQEQISTFGMEKFGQPLFVPNSEAWRTRDER